MQETVPNCMRSNKSLRFERFTNRNNIEIPNTVQIYLIEFMRHSSEKPKLAGRQLVNLFNKYQLFTQQTIDGEYEKTLQYYMIFCQLIKHYFALNWSIRTRNLIFNQT